MHQTGSVVRWGLLVTLLCGGAGLLSQPPHGVAQGQPPATTTGAPVIREAGWSSEKFADGVRRPGFWRISFAFDSADNLYVTNIGDIGILNDGGIQKVEQQIGPSGKRKVSDFTDATDVAAIAFDNKGRMAYSTGAISAMSEVYHIRQPDQGGTGTKIARGEFLLRMMPFTQQTQRPQIAWSLVYGKPNEQGEQPIYIGTSPVGMGGDEINTQGRILRISPDGTEVRGMANPYDVADMVMAPDGSLLFADHYDNVIYRVIPDGKGAIMRYATLTTNTASGIVTVSDEMLTYKRLTMDPAGNLYVMVRESDVKTNIYKVAAPQPGRPPRVTLFVTNIPQTMVPVIKSDSQGNLYLADMPPQETTLTIYRLTRAR
ncbi:MAG: hypothetical protein NZT92_03735 [Abditibacteriales bacterium]|nr:hypothetical protein [Abditibacteriales bacterium]MDW8365220.1 hypothetical protein [Abditibacteriales bacterium]